MSFRPLLIRATHLAFKSPSLLARDRYRDMERWPAQKLAAHRLTSLQHLVAFLRENNIFYRDLWDRHGAPKQISSLEDLQKFPTVTKDMIRDADREGRLISKPFVGDRSNFLNPTTGSSGQPIVVTLNRAALNERVGSVYAISEWYGLHVGDLWANLWRGPYRKSIADRIKEGVTGKTNISIYDPEHPLQTAMSEARCAEIVDELNRIRPVVIEGFVSALVSVSRHMLTTGKKLASPVRSVVTGAEMLTSDDREWIRKAFQCPVFNRYGGTEFSVIGHECEVQAASDHLLHTIDYRGVVEVERDGKSVMEQDGPILFTDFFSLAMPLVRYHTGDRGVMAGNPICACGRSLGLLREVTGRENDAFVLKDGRLLSSHLWHHYMKKCLDIRKYQIVQEAVDRFEVKMVLNPAVNQDELRHVKELIGEALAGSTIRWTVVDDIPAGPGGKQRQVIRKI